MTSPAAHEPADFSRLPADPRGFFELPSDFDRNALRRAYGRLVRQYKPDTYPGEFQQIRAAYEQLDTQLRYGNQQATPHTSAWQWLNAEQLAARTSDVSSPTAPATNRRSPTVASPVVERLDSEPAETLYRELQRNAAKTSYDYYVLAVLSDIVQRDDPLMFVKWLLRGLQQDNQDRVLLRLVQEYLRTEVEIARLPALLVSVSKVVTNDRFYFVTEPAWDRLLREADFATVRRTLAACERNLHDYRIAAKITFYLHVLRAAVWIADPAWLDAAFQFLDENAKELDARGEFEMELAGLARTVASARAAFLTGNAIRQKIIEALRTYCCAPPTTGMQAVIRCQVEIAVDAWNTMAAFPLGEAQAWNDVIQLWGLVTQEVAEETGVSYSGDASERRLDRATSTVIADMRQELEPVVQRFLRFRVTVQGVWLAALILIPLITLWGWLSLAALALLGSLGFLVGVIAYQFALRDKWIEPWFQRQLIRRLEAVYKKAWRPRLFRHQSTVREPPKATIERLYHAACETGDEQWLSWILDTLLGDPGFHVYALAQPFVR